MAWRRLGFGLATVLGLARRGFFIPYRYAGELPPPGDRPAYGALEALLGGCESGFRATLAGLDEVDRRVARALAERGWSIESESDRALVAVTAIGLASWGEEVRIDWSGDALVVESRCLLILQCFDWGKNRRNVVGFFAEFDRELVETLPASGGMSTATGVPSA